jgi:hypothetical protein
MGNIVRKLKKPISIALLVGAGATYGAGENVFLKDPPLGKDLYKVLTATYPLTWGKHANPWAQQFEENFEMGMVLLCRANLPSFASLLIDAGDYFAGFHPTIPNEYGEYTRLIRILNKHQLISRTTVASLNYERMIEEAAFFEGLTVFCEPVLDRTKRLVVLKPHGGWNFIYATPGVNVQGLVSVGSQHIYDGPVRRVDEHLEAALSWRTSGIPSAMSLFAPGKHSPVAPEYIQERRTDWASAARSASLIICIGVHPNPQDEHIWEPIKDSKADVWYIGGESPFRPYEDFQFQLGPRFSHLASTFDVGNSVLQKKLKKVL